jgi:hypothetical protein
MKLGPIIPILRIFDVAKAKEFYVDFLEFAIDWEHRFEPDLPLYMQVSKEGCAIHLSEHYGDACPGSAIIIEMEGIEAYHARLIGKRYRYYRPGLGDSGFGSLEMCLEDPFGNRLRFNQRLPEKA